MNKKIKNEIIAVIKNPGGYPIDIVSEAMAEVLTLTKRT